MGRFKQWKIDALGILLTLPALSGCAPPLERTSEPFTLEEATVPEIQKAMESGQISARDLTLAYLDRIRRLDASGPRINSILEVNPEAVEIAEALDAERAAQGPRGPLHGIPVILKESIQTGDRMQTTAASLALEGLVAPEDAFLVQKLRQAGAVILAKANLHEFAFGFTTVSSKGGQTLNPYSLDRYPGGSSGGTGAAVAANLGAVGIGEDTGGSIRVPASFNCLVGIRPTRGLVSRFGLVPLAPSRDTAGPMTRSVTDSALLLEAIAGYDPQDPVTAASVGKIPESYADWLDRQALRGARIGVLRAFFGSGPETEQVNALMEAAIDRMRKLGAVVVDPVTIARLEELEDDQKYPFQAYTELKFALGDYLKRLGAAAPLRTLEQIVATGLVHPAIEPKLRKALKVESRTDPVYLETVWFTHRTARLGALATLADHRLDAMVHPAVQRPPALIGEEQEGTETVSFSPRAGLPSVVVPAGFTAQGLPVAIEFLGRDFSEPRLIALAYAYEQATRHRRPPALPE